MGQDKQKHRLKQDPSIIKEYKECIRNLIHHEDVMSMENYIQHGDLSCLEHSIDVSYKSYLICRRLGLDYKSAARGGLLHDFFLYDWHIPEPERGLHAFSHPYTALRNANKKFYLNKKEKDIIVKHMWPLTIKPPKYRESLIVAIVDLHCSLVETIMSRINRKTKASLIKAKIIP